MYYLRGKWLKNKIKIVISRKPTTNPIKFNFLAVLALSSACLNKPNWYCSLAFIENIKAGMPKKVDQQIRLNIEKNKWSFRFKFLLLFLLAAAAEGLTRIVEYGGGFVSIKLLLTVYNAMGSWLLFSS